MNKILGANSSNYQIPTLDQNPSIDPLTQSSSNGKKARKYEIKTFKNYEENQENLAENEVVA